MLEVQLVDPRDDAAFDGWFGAFSASHRAMWPDHAGWQPVEKRARALSVAPIRFELLAARRDDETVLGAATLELPQRDNQHLASVSIEVRPDARRQGVATALLAEVERRARADGRRVVAGWQEEPVGMATPSPGALFAAARGYQEVTITVRRELSVPPDRSRLGELQTDAGAHAQGYRILTFVDAWPEEFVGDRALMGAKMSTDAPTGGLDQREEDWDVERVRQLEAIIGAMDRRLVVAAALDERSGRAVAFTEITVPRAVPERVYQWDTLVLSGHRGHRLGTLVKVANLGQLEAISPATRCVVTWNDGDNAPMIAVNQALGCTVVSIARTQQKHLTGEAGPSRA